MASRDFSYDASAFMDQEMQSDWNHDTSQYLWDSPQPDPSSNHPPMTDEEADSANNSNQIIKQEEIDSKDWALKSRNHQHSVEGTLSATSSVSEISSHSSSSTSSTRRKRKVAAKYNQPTLQTANATGSHEDSPSAIKFTKEYENSFSFLATDTNFPAMGMGLGGLSLDTAGTLQPAKYDFDTVMASPTSSPAGLYTDSTESFSQSAISPMRRTGAAPLVSPMTIQPSKTFFVGPSQENSPESTTLMNSHESSPAPKYSHMYSSLYPDGGGLSAEFPKTPLWDRNVYDSKDSRASDSSTSTTTRGSTSSTVKVRTLPNSQSSLVLTIDSIPEKSRVETQIPIRLTIQNAPHGVTKLHLPSYSISKPKYQTKPIHTRSSDTLELSAMLVCTSAMQKEGAQERAYQNAAEDIIPEWNEDYQPSTGGNNHADDSDPMRPLNGGPVAICPTCINRERKRAARKKTKKAEEEEEWAKDEAKRVIVFNCPEVKDWCVPGSKETAVKDVEEVLDTMFVNIPMRIACYCRHHGEKIGFQVIFTVKSADGEVLAQNSCPSIMITDDHKQPIAGGGSSAPPFPPKATAQMAGTSLFMPAQQAQAFNSTFSHPIPFRHSWSTNSLPMLQAYYASQRRPPAFQHESPTESQYSTAAATPRNLSRPASPSNGEGHSTKKRRSGGASRGKIPSSLAMTRIENMSPNSAESPGISGPSSAGPSTTQFAFSHSNHSSYGTLVGQQFPQMPTVGPYSFQSGPSTPSLNGPIPGSTFGPPTVEEMYQFYSAPTSQHPSRAPSPNGSNRFSGVGYANTQVPQQAALALASLPPGINLQKPPIVQRLIPAAGPQSGGEEVTILGSGFCQGLEIMFGDAIASNTVYWGDTTLVCIAPPSASSGKVPVVFQHQHHSGSQALQQLQGLMPTQILYYEYLEDQQNQMEGLSMGIIPRGQQLSDSQLDPGEMTTAYIHSHNHVGDHRTRDSSTRPTQQRPVSGSSNYSLGEGEFQRTYEIAP